MGRRCVCNMSKVLTRHGESVNTRWIHATYNPTLFPTSVETERALEGSERFLNNTRCSFQRILRITAVMHLRLKSQMWPPPPLIECQFGVRDRERRAVPVQMTLPCISTVLARARLPLSDSAN